MVPVEAHLALNHVPLVGLVFGLVFFVVGLKRSSQAALLTGLRIFVAMGIVVLLVAGSGLVTAHLLAIAGLGASMWAAYLGGALRHTELGRVHLASTSRMMRQISMGDVNVDPPTGSTR